MYTVIIPTMWRSNEIEQILPIIDMHPLIGEIIIINNAVHCTPDWFLNDSFATVKSFDMPQNTYVNPAWNMGVKNASYDKICLLSDDVYFDPDVFDVLEDKLSPADGCIGPGMTSIHNTSAGIQIKNREKNQKQPLGYGTLLFFNKQNFVPIPKPLKIFYGDTWIYIQSVVQHKEPRMLHNFNIKTKLGTTSMAVTSGSVQGADSIWWETNIKNHNDILNYKEA
jgi:hypothetical protein